MSVEVGTAYVSVVPSARGFSSKLAAQTGGASAVAGAAGGAKFGGAFKAAAAVGIAAAGAAVVGLGAKAVAEFTQFDEGMREVFSLIPDASDEMRAGLTDDIKSVSKEFGFLTDDAVPSLYAALSAGVPPENAISFIEDASKLAVGGVIPLEGAVDVLTSTINAYASQNLSAAEAADILTIAVRNGKTTMPELNSSLAQVTPIAAAMGISFEEAAASISTITAKGASTSAAATQMKAVFSELGKEGSIAGDNFERIAGQSFPNFIKSGGSVSDALNMMADDAEANGGSVTDMFGSIEAGQGVLGLTGANAEVFAGNVDDMANSAGATEDAFNEMEGGIGNSMDRLRAAVEVAFINMGEKIAPFVKALADFLTDMPGWVEPVAIALGVVAAAFTVGAVALGVFTAASWLLAASPIFWIPAAIVLIVAALTALYFKFDGFRAVVDAAWQAVQVAWDGIYGAISTVVEWLMTNVPPVWAAVSSAVMSSVGAAATVVRTSFNTIKSVISGVVSAVKTIVSVGFAAVKGFIIEPLQASVGVVRGVVDAIVGVFSGLVDRVAGALGGLAGVVGNALGAAAGAAKAAWNGTIGGKGISIPGFDPPGPGPSFGGLDFTIPRLHSGGPVTGPAGSEQLRILEAGEWVLSRAQVAALSSGSSGAPSPGVSAGIEFSGPVYMNDDIDLDRLAARLNFEAASR